MLETKRGKFIVFEGLDGSGKSTQIGLLSERLRIENKSIKLYETQEPTDSPIGALIRQHLTGRTIFDDTVMVKLFAADRLDHLTNHVNGIYKKIIDGITVICDRYYLSSLAYQGIKTSFNEIINENKKCMEILKPDIHIYLDVPPDETIKRIEEERQHREIYDNERDMILVRDRYLRVIKDYGDDENIVIINSLRPKEIVAEDIWKHIEKL